MQKSLLQWRLSVLLLFIVCSCSNFNASAQLSYAFSSSSGTYSAISGTTVFSGSADESISGNLFLGFTFTYGRGTYTDFRVSSNGWISLGNNTTQALPTNALTTINNGPIIAPLWDDLLIPAGGITYSVTGATGSRVLTVQWASARWNASASGSVMSFQIKLYETSNIIEFIYSQGNKSVNSGSASIGLNGGFSSGDFYSVSSINGPAVATYGVETNTINTKPSEGMIYRWTPQNMSVVSATTGQVTGAVSKCNNLQQAIINVQVVTRGSSTPLTLSQLKFSILTTVATDLTGIHIFYTGDCPGYSPINEFGPGTITPASGSITVSGTQKLMAGTNYFWIAYDVSPTSVTAHTLDAECTEVTVAGSPSVPSPLNPASWRTIADCSAAPGGITNASFWIKADAGTSSTTNNTRISSWNDQSGNSRHATNGTTNNQPRYYNNSTNNVNFNPIVDFDEASQDGSNADYMDITSNGILSANNNPYEVYALIIPGVKSLTSPGKFLFSGDAGINTFNSFDVRSSYSVNDSWGSNDLIVANSWSTDNPTMLTFDYGSPKRETYLSGASIGSRTSPIRTTGNSNNALGYQRGIGLEYYDGGIAEIITYANVSHGTTTRQKVESYLAIKYGVTLAHNYLSSNGTVVWDITTNAAYNKNIIGIARDDNGALLQKQSKSTSLSKDILTVYIGPSKQTSQASNTGTFASNDKSFFMVGTNKDRPLSLLPLNPEVPPGICCRIDREWLVQQTNFTNTDIKLEFNFNSVTPGTVPLNTADLRLLVDADGNFINATILNTPTISISAAAGIATITVPASAFTGKAYFTLASVSTNTLLPIELNSFTGLCRDSDIQIKWATAQTATTDFTVERSADKVNFSAIGVVKSNTSGYYTWVDQSPLPGTMYYRLKTVAENGATQYSSIIAINGCNQNHTMLTTDPVTGESMLTLQLLRSETTEISLFDGLGQKLNAPGVTGKRSMTRGVYYIPVKIPGSAAGMYLLHVNINGDKQVYRILKR